MHKPLQPALLLAALAWPLAAAADLVGDVHELALRTARAAGAAGTAQYTLAMVDLAMFDAANAIERRYEPYRALAAPPAGADPAAAALGAGCAALAGVHPAQQTATSTACDALVATLPASRATADGRAFGETVGKAQVASRQGDGLGAPNRYRPLTVAGAYVPTVLPIGVDMAAVKPFALTSPAQFRPGPPPALTGEAWARDFNEVKAVGARSSTLRTPQQTATALFWASAGAQQFFDSVPDLPPIAPAGVADRARFLALLHVAIADAVIAHFDAKYTYNFWRPVTAIRNGDLDGNDATERDAGWMSLIDAPLHPEYPCAHCNVSAAFAAVLAAVLGEGELAVPLTLKSAAIPGGTASTRSWKRATDFVPEVADARVWSGIHYRNSTAAGMALGHAVGRWVVTTQLRPLPAPR
jgi:hypothetical protein